MGIPLSLRRNIQTTSLTLFLAALSLFAPATSSAQSKDSSPLNFPVPRADNMIFYLQRDPTINTVIYALNINNRGELNESDPLNIYWIRYTENNLIKDLSYIQRKFAFGIDSKKIAKDRYELRFVSYKKLVFLLQRGADKKFFVTVNVNNRTIRLTRIYVRIEGGTFWIPNVKYAELEGTDVATGKPATERISVK